VANDSHVADTPEDKTSVCCHAIWSIRQPFDHNSDESLQQHKREPPTHTFDCTTSNRHYGSGTALQQHLRDSPVHAPPLTVTTAIDLSIAKRRCSSTCGIHQRMPRPSTVRPAIDPSATSGRYSSTYATLRFMLRPLTVTTAIDLSISKMERVTLCILIVSFTAIVSVASAAPLPQISIYKILS
jgi:hypothetical protein